MLNQVLAIKKILKTTKEYSIKKIKNIVSDLNQQRQKESTVFSK